MFCFLFNSFLFKVFYIADKQFVCPTSASLLSVVLANEAHHICDIFDNDARHIGTHLLMFDNDKVNKIIT